MYAKSTLAGRLTTDPQFKNVGANNTPLVKFTLAVNTYRGGEEKVHYFSLQAWGKLAEFINDRTSKGMLISVACDMEQERWEDSSTGKVRSKVTHKVTDITLMTSNEPRTENKSKPTSYVREFGYDGFTSKQRKKEEQEALTTHKLADMVPLPGSEDDDDIPF